MAPLRARAPAASRGRARTHVAAPPPRRREPARSRSSWRARRRRGQVTRGGAGRARAGGACSPFPFRWLRRCPGAWAPSANPGRGPWAPQALPPLPPPGSTPAAGCHRSRASVRSHWLERYSNGGREPGRRTGPSPKVVSLGSGEPQPRTITRRQQGVLGPH